MNISTSLRAAVGALIVSVSCSGGPSNYDDCILQNIKSGMSDYAARQITKACRKKFPESFADVVVGLVELPPTARGKLTGKLGPRLGSNWGGNIYNANEDWQVDEVRILIYEPTTDSEWTRSTTSLLADGAEEYLVDVSIPPLSNASFGLSVNWGDEDYDWRIDSARGRKVR